LLRRYKAKVLMEFRSILYFNCSRTSAAVLTK
jgi:hypothetical protein